MSRPTLSDLAAVCTSFLESPLDLKVLADKAAALPPVRQPGWKGWKLDTEPAEPSYFKRESTRRPPRERY